MSIGRVTLFVFVIVTVSSLGLMTTAGGIYIPIDTKVFLFTGEQSISMYMIIVGITGIGVAVIKRETNELSFNLKIIST